MENDLKTLPDNLFIGMKKLCALDFSQNKLGRLSSNLFEPIVHTLEIARFENNPSINARFVKGTNETLAVLMNLIDTNCNPPINMRAKNVQQEDLHWTTLLETGEFSDFKIKIDQEIIKVHKAILAKSPVLKQLETEMAEKRNGVLIIKGFTLGAVKDFLNFLYTGTVTDEEHALEMFALASTYNVQPLRSICKKIIMDYLDDSNALEIYILGHLYLCDDLILAVLEEIEEFW